MKKICCDGIFDHSSVVVVAAEAVAGNEDLVREIFLRLPVRSLIRFKLVSKQWSSLISDPQFACDRTHRLNPISVVPSGLFFYNSLTKSQKIDSVSLDNSPIQLSRVRVPSLSFLDMAAAGAKITILQSCNGLLFCRFTSQSSYSNVRNDYCVCNPTTKKYTILPQLRLNQQEKASGFTLAFDPSISPYYKVVCTNIVSYGDMRIEIYSSENGNWTASDYRSYERYYDPFKRGTYWNGAIHWIKRSSIRFFSYEFDFKEENFKGVDMPPNPQSFCHLTLRYFGEFRGHLHLIYVRTRSEKKFQILERDRETLKWSVKYRVHICHLVSKFPEMCVKPSQDVAIYSNVEYAFSILCVFKGEQEEDSALVLTIPGKVISYNLHHKTSKVLCELPSQVIDTSGYDYMSGFNFTETLASV